MLKNYFTIAINNLLKNKLYSAINIIGLAIGIAACIIITLYVQDELSYDKKWEKADYIYQINCLSKAGFGKLLRPTISPLALSALIKFFPEDIESGTRIQRKRGIDKSIQIGNVCYPGWISLVDEEFINIFQVEVLKGSLKNTFQAPGNIALSEESATQYFGKSNSIGEVITFRPDYKHEEQYKVTAVYRFKSSNTVLNVPNFSLLDKAKIEDSLNWRNIEYQTIIRFNETADINNFINRLPDFINRTIPATSIRQPLEPGKKMSDVLVYSLQKWSEMYFNSNSVQVFPAYKKKGNKIIITVLIAISLIILFIGCINFIILTTAKATQRAREVAMRKVVGARFKQLFIQFLGESVLIAFIAFLLALALTELVLPFFEVFVDKKLIVPYSSPESYIFVILLLLSVGLLGGLYPALVLSRFSPSRVLKANQSTEANDSFKLRNVLVVFQFAASIALIISTVIAYCQLQYTNKHDPGFNPEKLLVVDCLGKEDAHNHIETLQQELLKLPAVNNVALSNIQPKLGGVNVLGNPLRAKTNDSTPSQRLFFNYMMVDYNFFGVYEISLLSGRYFTHGVDREESGPFSISQPGNYKRIIINLAAARQLGFASAEDAVGKILESGDPDKPYYSELSIIGVVADSQYRSLRQKPAPEVYQLVPDSTQFLNVKYQGDYQTVIEEVKRVWHKVVGEIPFKDSNVNRNLATTFAQEEQENKVLIAFALLAIFIACMGLFGMAAFTVERRVKEIGLRKVMGAKVVNIVNLLGWNFLKPVLIANVIAWPVAIFAMQSWLERFPYRFNPLYMIPICLVSGFIALAIAWFTVAGNTKRVAKRNPIKALRYE